MATVLYLNDTRVYPNDSQAIKLTKENPYFTQSDSYTLDVVLPMDVYENRVFFANINRMEVKKTTETMTCRLVVDSKLLLAGSARVTQVTEKEVKVQLLGGNSELKFMGDDEEYYIDRLSLGEVVIQRRSSQAGDYDYWVDTGISCVESFINNESVEGQPYATWHFGLLDIIKQVFRTFGFTVTECCIDRTPWNALYVASAKRTYCVSQVLPHWSVRTFIDEICKFFNVTVIINQEKKTVCIKDNPTFFSTNDIEAIEPVEEYTAEMNEDSDAHALAADNLRFDMSGSEHHDYDMIPDNVRENAQRVAFASATEAYNAWSAASEDDKKGKIYEHPQGLYTGWLHYNADTGNDDDVPQYTQIDVFGPLVRNNATENETELKICPVAMAVIDYSWTRERRGGGSTDYRWTGIVPSLENPTGHGIQARPGEDEEPVSIQEYINGEADIEKAEKEDRLQVMFVDDVEQPCHYYANGEEVFPRGRTERTMIAGFTDYLYKKASGVTHNLWSLSLNPCAAAHYLGQLHQNGFSFNLRAKICFRFLYDSMPDPTKVFVIRGKKYGCEKIEATIGEHGMEKLMTGYFYEMVSREGA